MEKHTQVSSVVNPFEHYRNIIERRDAKEIRSIAHVKRFMECLAGDPGFRQELIDTPKRAKEIAGNRGLDVDPSSLVPIWRKGFRIDIPNDDLNGWPVARMWATWIRDVIKFRILLRDWADMSGVNPRFHAWRLRQIARADGDLGDLRKAIVHAILSFELTSGCSVGCWFCGLGATKFERAWPHTPENTKLWREILQVCNETFGQAAQTAFCYHATEPSDNPEYLDFIDDFCDVIGVLPQTTTAVPVKNLEWTRRLLKKHHQQKCVPSRFSILTLGTLHKVHEHFGVEELFGIELLHQQKGSILSKANAGHVRTRGTDLGKGNLTPEDHPSLGTIACVSGFLVNMVEKTLKLISPCRSSDRWPMGYRIHYQGTFGNAQEFRSLIDDAVESCMPARVNGTEVISFRPGLDYQRESNGCFTLTSYGYAHKVTGASFVGLIGDTIATGEKTAGEVLEAAVKNGGDVFAVGATINDLFKKGFLDDDPARGENPPTGAL